MVDLKKYNYFTGEKSDIGFGVGDIVRFLDLAGHNYILFTPPRPSDSSKVYDLCLFHHLENKIEFKNIEEFREKIHNKSNLFRVDLIVFDFWSIKKMNLKPYLKEIEKLPQKFIIVAKEFQYASNDDVNDFHIRKEYKDLRKVDFWITDKISGNCATLESLKKSYIRDKKLEYLFHKE